MDIDDAIEWANRNNSFYYTSAAEFPFRFPSSELMNIKTWPTAMEEIEEIARERMNNGYK